MTTNKNHYRVVRLQSENIKRIEAVDITPEGDLVIVAGNNGHGKTSVLDSIMYALGGKDCVAQEPVRRGEAKGSVTVDCGAFVATREFAQTGQKLILKNKDGKPISRPQEFLDSILGDLSFDPLAFAQKKSSDRLKSLLSLTDGLDESLAAIDAKRSKLYEERKEWNVTIRNLNGQLADMPKPGADWPEGEVNPQIVIDEKNRLQKVIDANMKERQTLANLEEDERDGEKEVRELTEKLKNATESLAVVFANRMAQEKLVDGLVDPDLSKIDDKLNDLIEENKLAVKRRQYESISGKKELAEETAKSLTDQIDQCDRAKEHLLSSAKLPIPGLGFSDGDVVFNGILFDQLSDAEKLKVSLSMAMAANPSMRVIRITNGSLLDENNLAIVRQMAVENDYQVWIECVGNREDATVIIENGKVKADEIAEQDLREAEQICADELQDYAREKGRL